MSQSLPPAIPPSTATAASPAAPLLPCVEQTLTQLEAAARELEGQPEALLALLRRLE